MSKSLMSKLSLVLDLLSSIAPLLFMPYFLYALLTNVVLPSGVWVIYGGFFVLTAQSLRQIVDNVKLSVHKYKERQQKAMDALAFSK